MIRRWKDKVTITSEIYGKKFGFDLPYFVRNGSWMFLHVLVSSVSSLALYMAFARLSSSEMFGQYQLVISIMALIYIFSIPGLNTSLSRSVARGYDGNYKPAVRKSFLGSLVGVPVLFLIGAYYYHSDSSSLGISLMIAAAFFPFLYAPNTWEWFLQGKHLFRTWTKFSSVQAIFNTAATLLAIFFSRDNLVLIVSVYLASYALLNVFYYYKSRKYIENHKKDEEFWEFGWFMTKIYFLGIVANNIDKVLVGILLGPADLAIYTYMTFIVLRLKDALKGAMSLFFPKMSTLKISFSELVRLQKNKLLVFASVLLTFTVVYFFSIPYVNEMVFTKQYSQYSHISQIFCITFFLSIPVAILGYYINATKNHLAIALANPLSNLIQIILNVLLIWKFKLLGAALAFNLSLVVGFSLHIYGIIKEEETEKTNTV